MSSGTLSRKVHAARKGDSACAEGGKEHAPLPCLPGEKRRMFFKWRKDTPALIMLGGRKTDQTLSRDSFLRVLGRRPDWGKTSLRRSKKRGKWQIGLGGGKGGDASHFNREWRGGAKKRWLKKNP